MNRLFKLLQVEFIKIYTKNFVFFAFIFFIVVILFSADNLDHEIETAPRDDYWIGELQDENINIDMYISSNPDIDSKTIDEFTRIKEINLYRIENNLQPPKDKSITGLLEYNHVLYMLVVIVSLIVSTRIITDDFKYDSIKILTTCPYSRKEILTSKFIIVAITPVLVMSVIFLFVVIFGGIYFGFSNLNSTYVDYVNGHIIAESNFIYIVKQWIQQSFSLISISALAVFLGIVFKNALISILTTVLLYMFGTYLTVILVDYNWIKFTIFPHINYYLYTYDDVKLPDFSSSFSYMITMIYLTIFVLSSYIVFDKKEL